jgi:signal transduction histidine kinase
MNIRLKLTLKFSAIVVSLLLIFVIGIYYFSASFRNNEFHSRLKNRAITTAKLLLNVKEVDEKLLKIIDKNSHALDNEHVYILDYNLNQLYSNSDQKFDYFEIIPNINKYNIFKFKYKNLDALGIIYIFNNKKYIVIATAYDTYGFSMLKHLQIILLICWVIGIIITTVAGFIFSRKALEPISKVVNQVNKISITNLSLRLDEGNKKDEIAQLSLTFNKMLDRLEEAFILQRDFVSNAAHELRTPFTIMLTEISYCQLYERTKLQYINTINNLSIELSKLSKLSNSLLDLASLNFTNSNFDFKSLRIDELIVESCNIIVNKQKHYKPTIHFDKLPENDELLTIWGNEELLIIALKNLIENGCKFSYDQKVDIYISVSACNIIVNFLNNGIGISKEDQKNIFQPFFRGKNTKYISGHGIGLSLTLKIVELHKGYLIVDSEEMKETNFILNLPNRQKYQVSIR